MTMATAHPFLAMSGNVFIRNGSDADGLAIYRIEESEVR